MIDSTSREALVPDPHIIRDHLLIIGGTRGLGAALAEQARVQYEHVSILARRPPDTPSEGVRYYCADLANSEALNVQLLACIAEQGRVDSLAFTQRFRGEQDWEGELQVSLSATREVIELCSDQFSCHHPAIVVMSSNAAWQIAEEQPLSYHVAKAGLEQLVRYYAVTLAPKGIRVNGVSSGPFIKPEGENSYHEQGSLKALHEEIVPLGRLPRSDEVAEVMLYLLSQGAAMVTGQNLHVDGGLSLVGQESLARRVRGI